jgi:hypothetical protein
MAEPIESFTLNEGYDAYGAHTSVTFEGDQAVKKITYDAEPLLKEAAAERIATAGERWGDGRKVGTIPMPVYNQILQTYQGREERERAILSWLRLNTAFVTFDKFLKV